MTTIAYHHSTQIICVDSLTTTSHSIVTDQAQKCQRVYNGFVFASGNCTEIYHLLSNWQKNCFEAISCTFFFINKQDQVFYGEIRHGKRFLEPLQVNWAIGSGANWAIAAMDFGKSALEAVQYACKRDKSTGGKVHTFSLSNTAKWLSLGAALKIQA
ncbi:MULTISPECIES: proteasome subunit alpha [Pseudoalteromonas]|uniref:Proteasome subunit alpha n=1 Tax=Pseudoalteromonas obscura TaxID=3048491 RepID=A0ABT7EHU8_9GAMM|nr:MULTISPECIES: proteasome subunit alpha [Pseudoalteromonas]MBQ4836243.1 proteasome subunit alpha [Pseudoalteromonas luteoviolacea]MDK2594593.1 proteasome subunit alpha [Pseudoalteromonas sp. P94(2023)]